MPFVGETGRARAGREGERSADENPKGRPPDRAPDRAGLPTEGGLAERLADARRSAAEHRDHDVPRAPRPERMER